MGFVLFNHKTNNDDKHIETKFILAHEVRMIINIMMKIVMIKTNWVKDWVVSNVKFREAFLKKMIFYVKFLKESISYDDDDE